MTLNPFPYLNRAWDKAVAPKPLNQIITEGLIEVRQEIFNREDTIRRESFAKYMAVEKQDAMIRWVALDRAQWALAGGNPHD